MMACSDRRDMGLGRSLVYGVMGSFLLGRRFAERMASVHMDAGVVVSSSRCLEVLVHVDIYLLTEFFLF